MDHYTIEQQGMLKMLKRLYQLLKNGKTITWGDIAYEIGMEAKYWRKLINGGIIENTNFPSKPRYQWVSRIPPNIHMAVETLKTDMPDYSNENIQKEFNTYRAEKNLIDHSVFLVFDIDYSDNKHISNFSELREQVSHIKNVAYCGLSVSGKGFWGLVPIPKSTPEIHKQRFESLKRDFKEFNINLDASGRDISIPMTYFLDPDAYINNNAKVYTKIIAQHKPELIQNSITLINIPFIEFWNLYDKKIGKNKTETKWNNLSNKDRILIMEYVPKYIQARPDVTYRRNPEIFINKETWLDEIVTKQVIIPHESQPLYNYPISKFTDQQLWDELVRRGYVIENNQMVKKLS